MKDLIQQIQDLMYSHSYQIALGILKMDNCNTIILIKTKLELIFKDTYPDEVVFKPCSKTEFWKEINYGFDFKGVANDESNSKKQDKLNQLIVEYKTEIEKLTDEESEFFHYVNDNSILKYPTFWNYQFVVLNKNSPSIYLYGNSSD